VSGEALAQAAFPLSNGLGYCAFAHVVILLCNHVSSSAWDAICLVLYLQYRLFPMCLCEFFFLSFVVVRERSILLFVSGVSNECLLRLTFRQMPSFALAQW
jgi:hypothetical protein